MLLINYEINPILTLSEDCILISVGTLPCLILGGDQIAHFGEKNPQVHLIIIIII